MIRTVLDAVENSKKYSKECLFKNIIDKVIGFIDNKNTMKILNTGVPEDGIVGGRWAHLLIT